MLLEQAADLLHGKPGAGRDPPLARAVDDGGLTPLARGHGIDDADLAAKLPGVETGRGQRLGLDAGQLVHELVEATHIHELA